MTSQAIEKALTLEKNEQNAITRSVGAKADPGQYVGGLIQTLTR